MQMRRCCCARALPNQGPTVSWRAEVGKVVMVGWGRMAFSGLGRRCCFWVDGRGSGGTVLVTSQRWYFSLIIFVSTEGKSSAAPAALWTDLKWSF